jgi:hypothetical protein
MAWFTTLNTNGTGSGDVYQLMTSANTISDGLYMPVMLLVIFLVWVLGSVSIGKPIARSILFASFMCSVLSILMVIMNWLSVNYMYFAFFMVAVGIIWTWLSEALS